MHYQCKEIRALNILLGSACNMQCGYCIQRDDVKEKKPSSKKHDVEKFCENFAKWTKENKVRIGRVNYWGGEPLLYFKQMRTIHAMLSVEHPEITMHRVTTNGTLVTDAYVEWANSDPTIFTVVSFHEGKITDEQWKKIARLENFSIESLLRHGQLFPTEMGQKWEQVCEWAGRQIPVSFDPLRATEGVGKGYWLTEDDIHRYISEMQTTFLCANMGELSRPFEKTLIAHFLWKFIRDLKTRTKYGAPCVNSTHLSVDLEGNTYQCHHDNSKENITGNIFKKVVPIRVFDSAKPDPKKYYASEECRSCFAFESCGGGCYTSKTHEIECLWYRERHLLATSLLERKKNATQGRT